MNTCFTSEQKTLHINWENWFKIYRISTRIRPDVMVFSGSKEDRYDLSCFTANTLYFAIFVPLPTGGRR
jgi:hypothetical protein